MRPQHSFCHRRAHTRALRQVGFFDSTHSFAYSFVRVRGAVQHDRSSRVSQSPIRVVYKIIATWCHAATAFGTNVVRASGVYVRFLWYPRRNTSVLDSGRTSKRRNQTGLYEPPTSAIGPRTAAHSCFSTFSFDTQSCAAAASRSDVFVRSVQCNDVECCKNQVSTQFVLRFRSSAHGCAFCRRSNTVFWRRTAQSPRMDWRESGRQ